MRPEVTLAIATGSGRASPVVGDDERRDELDQVDEVPAEAFLAPLLLVWLGAMVAIALAVIGASRAVRAGLLSPTPPPKPPPAGG